jgi:tetraacyldisaccharide 4'-kinase
MIMIEQWILQKQKSPRWGCLKSVLFVLSFFYKSGVWARHLLYKVGFFKIHQSSLPVISVGNIVCGGTGKSEFVAKLIKDIEISNIAILSRGYRSKREGPSRIVKDIDDGDEPFMLQMRFKDIPVIVGRKREESANLAKKLGSKAVILDDGMQYLALKKDLQIVLVRADQPFGGGFVPLGMRRELLEKLNCADYIVIHGATSEENYELVKRSLLCYSLAKCFGTRYCLDKNKKLIDMKVGVFCGVGNPQFFMSELNSLGLVIVKEKILSDHQKVKGLKDFCIECRKLGAEKVVCTTKDYVKLSVEEKALVTAVEVDMKISFDAVEYGNLIDKINNNIS